MEYIKFPPIMKRFIYLRIKRENSGLPVISIRRGYQIFHQHRSLNILLTIILLLILSLYLHLLPNILIFFMFTHQILPFQTTGIILTVTQLIFNNKKFIIKIFLRFHSSILNTLQPRKTFLRRKSLTEYSSSRVYSKKNFREIDPFKRYLYILFFFKEKRYLFHILILKNVFIYFLIFSFFKFVFYKSNLNLTKILIINTDNPKFFKKI